VNLDAEAQVRAGSPRGVKESKKETDQAGVAVGEDDTVAAPVWLALPALAPVGDRPRDEEFAVSQRANLGGSRIADSRTLSLADRTFGGPVAVSALGRTFSAFGVAEPVGMGARTQAAGPGRGL
jgi:hypothetical protein